MWIKQIKYYLEKVQNNCLPVEITGMVYRIVDLEIANEDMTDIA